MSYNLFLDDQRDPEHVTWMGRDYKELKWVVIRSYPEFVSAIEKQGLPELVSFDHDLADEHYPWNNIEGIPRYGTYKELTGYDCAKWLVDYCLDKELKLPECLVHSHNIIGKENIIKYLESARASANTL